MPQETTQEFAARLNQAIEAYPTAPPTPHGRLSWLKRELERQGTKVSLNTVHKWIKGMSRPREDKMRDLARFLKVDEVWLSLGRRPLQSSQAEPEITARAKGAVLYVAGLVEVAGGRVNFPATNQKDPTSIQVDLGDGPIGVVVVTPQSHDEATISFVVPEPVGQDRIWAVVPGTSLTPALHDITAAPRQMLGGFSIATFNTSKNADANPALPAPIKTLKALEKTTA
ncbi:hypothetical protein [Salibaculum griseiflavum]|uniref:HTH cro/C1-type domain-containing protein n=1 Tax=Salibaculum griseiflavum TaxID=1914409 RepID=A0A2V1P346_9RHOB|nr:hypothetical protein [Salibaculum griseiflavum]PWG15837.1 hypothetical protein DFK10_15000 [Salibaculum griseiflavum]